MINYLFRLFSSVKLSVYCLLLLFILVILTTAFQVYYGIYFAVSMFMTSWFVTFTLPGYLNDNTFPVFPGGFLVGTVLVINLLVVHFQKFTFSFRKSGIWLTHFSVILLLIGAAITYYSSTESLLSVREGQSVNYTEHQRFFEIALIDTSLETSDTVYSIDQSHFNVGSVVDVLGLNISFKVLEYYANSDIQILNKVVDSSINIGVGGSTVVKSLPVFKSDNLLNIPSLLVSFYDEHDVFIGKCLLSGLYEGYQTISVNGKNILLLLRKKRFPLPFTLLLNRFVVERYHGTNLAKRYESHVTVDYGENSEIRDVVISMNQPFRSDGLTMFQASFTEDENGTVLQVVDNMVWIVPYIACFLLGFGLIIQFLLSFIFFIKKRRRKRA